jgi:aminoglycoside phosphotransferase family enzyme
MHRYAPVISVEFDPKAQIATFNDIASIRPFLVKHSSTQNLEVIDKAIAVSDAFISQYAGRIRERGRLGFIRDIHGDLHSGNIFIDDKPIIFDCIECNDAFRQIDVLSDIAFLCMDLEAFGHDALCEIFLSVYCDRFLPFKLLSITASSSTINACAQTFGRK